MIARRSTLLVLLMLSLASFSAVALAYSMLMKTFRMTTSGIFAQVETGFYSDENCTMPIESIEWGILLPGSNKSHVLYLRNEGNVGLALAVNMTNLTPPEVSEYISLSTNYDGHVIPPNQILALSLILHVALDAQGGGFSFDIEISYSP